MGRVLGQGGCRGGEGLPEQLLVAELNRWKDKCNQHIRRTRLYAKKPINIGPRTVTKAPHPRPSVIGAYSDLPDTAIPVGSGRLCALVVDIDPGLAANTLRRVSTCCWNSRVRRKEVAKQTLHRTLSVETFTRGSRLGLTCICVISCAARSC
ncbi:hypothetical protein LY76DRAFT_182049 [Colletotrichum caudatum]|nr:hypothetical protein LY76DRAFT_182049 [Colletotrichum caudatum]